MQAEPDSVPARQRVGVPPVRRRADVVPGAGRAFETLLAAQLTLTTHHGGLLRAALAGAAGFEAMRHYPAHDVVDRRHGVRYFFHAHPDAFALRGEYGHFHVFLDPRGSGGGHASHLIGIALDGQGLPVRLFTVNRWVTGEHWQDHASLVARLEQFDCLSHGRLAPVSRWVSAAVQAWSGEISRLIEQRDRRITRLCGKHRRICEVFEDRSIEVLTERSVALLPPGIGGANDEEKRP